MSFIEMGLGDDVKEPEPKEEGVWPLRVEEVNTKMSKSNKPMVEIRHSIEGDEEAPPVYHYINIPTGDDEAKTKQFKLLTAKRYLTLANVPFDATGFNPDDIQGAAFNAYLVVETGDDGTPRNTIKLPRLQED